MTRPPRLPILAALALLCASACGRREPADPRPVLRVGHFVTLTHAHALAARDLTEPAQGWFERRLGMDLRIEWHLYTAGPSAMEAMLAGALDLCYVGPQPVLNAHLRTAGAEIRVLAGAVRGGAALVVRKDLVRRPGDLRGRRIGTPQFGNTQDIACRAWLLDQGLRVTQAGGDVRVVPMALPDLFALFRRGELDAIWAVEPWVANLELLPEAEVLHEDEGSLTTILAASAAALRDRPEAVRRFLEAHAELDAWMRAEPEAARTRAVATLDRLLGRPLLPKVAGRAYARLRLGTPLRREDLEELVRVTRRVGFSLPEGSLDRLLAAPAAPTTAASRPEAR